MKNLHIENETVKLLKKDIILDKGVTGLASIDKPWLKKKKYNDNKPDANMTLYNFLLECNKNNLDDVILIYDPVLNVPATNITFRELFAEIDKVARSYLALGVKKGDIVTVSLPSFVENIVSFYALNKIGAVTNQIHPLVSQDELDYYLEEAESSIFVGYGDIASKVDKLKYDKLKKVILVKPLDSASTLNKFRIIKDKIKKEGLKVVKETVKSKNLNKNLYISWKEFLELGKKVKKDVVNYDPTILATLTHTSGTSGKSKAVMHNSVAYNNSVKGILQETDLFKRGNKELLVLPPLPIYILCNVLHLALSVGIKLVVIPQVDYKNMSAYFDKHHPNYMKGVPFIVQQLIKDPNFKKDSLKDFIYLISGGAKLNNVDEINDFLREHGSSYEVANGYGESELGGCVTFMFDNTYEPGTVGRPVIGNNVKIMSLDGKKEISYKSDELGEIWLSSPSMMMGYYKNKEATDEVMVTDEDGITWIKTGDLGKVTEEGNVKVSGRIKRMTFIFDYETNSPSKVSNEDVENALCESSQVEKSIVVAIRDKNTENALKAYVVVKDSPYTSRDDYYSQVITNLDKRCKQRFRKYVSPVEYVVVDDIPTTKSGKEDYRYVEEFDKKNLDDEKSKMKVLYKKKVNER